MAVDNRDRADAIASRILVQENPPSEDSEELEFDAQDKLSKVMLELGAEGINIKSLSEERWKEYLENMGLSPDQALMLLEDVAGWGVTDDEDSEELDS